ncbi:unnamed protein product [Prunus armeniaca]
MVGSKCVDPKKAPIHPDDEHFIMELKYAGKFVNNGKDYEEGTIEEDDVVEASGEASLHSVPVYDNNGDEFDKEIYDEENDAALEDDNMFMHNVQIPKVLVYVEKKKKKYEKPFIPQGHMNDTLPDENYNSDGFEVRETNVGSIMMMKIEAPYFQRLYVCLDACEKGLSSYNRPIIGVDGCHLQGTFQGQLLMAAGIDANDNMYQLLILWLSWRPKNTWCWFLQLLIKDLGPVSEHEWTFILDQQKGLDVALDLVVPEAAHKWCVRRFYGNFKTFHRGRALKDLLEHQMWLILSVR